MRLDEPIGFIGVGAMGAPMVRHLLTLHRQVILFDLNQATVASLVAAGARAAPSPAALASEAEVVFTCLPSLAALQAAVLGEDGLCRGTKVKTYVDFSTTGSEFARATASALRTYGVDMIDAPITGNVMSAGNGRLGIMCSGPTRAFAHARPILEELASTIVLYLGEENGRAQTLKLLNNMLSATGMAASCEAMLLGVKAGLSPELMLQVINTGDSSSSASRNKFPRSILARQFDFGARMAITAKDISLTVEEAEDLGVPMWITQSVRQIWKYAVSQGGAERDGTSLITYLEPWAGVEVRAGANPVASEPAAVTASWQTDHVALLIAPDALSIVKARLEAAGWAVTRAGEKDIATEGARDVASPHCTLLPIEQDAAWTQALEAVVASRAVHSVVNACPMSADRAAALARHASSLGKAYLEIAWAEGSRGLRSGSGGLLVAGSRAAFAAGGEWLCALGGVPRFVGERPGTAMLLQQINGALFAVLLAATCESYITGASAGLDPLTMAKILGLETGRNAASSHIIPEQVVTRRFDYGKTLAEVLQDLNHVCDSARELGVTTWIMDKARLLFGLAVRLGTPLDDVTTLMQRYEAWVGVEVRSPLRAP